LLPFVPYGLSFHLLYTHTQIAVYRTEIFASCFASAVQTMYFIWYFIILPYIHVLTCSTSLYYKGSMVCQYIKFYSIHHNTWSLTLRQEQRLKVFKNGVLREIFGPKGVEVTIGGRPITSTTLVWLRIRTCGALLYTG